MSTKKPSSKQKSVKFLLAPRPQKDPLAADFEAPQHVLIPQDGTSVEDIRQKLPDFDPQVFVSKEETKKGMLERAHNADGITFDSDVLQAMSKDFDFEDPNNLLQDDFMEQAGGLMEDEGEMLDGEMTDLAAELFEDEPEVITFDQDDEHENGESNKSYDGSYDSDDYDIDKPDWQDEEKVDEPANFGKKLILFKKKANKTPSFLKPRDRHDSSDDKEETKSVFTNFSMTSSVLRRSQGLQQIDEHFERLYEKEYADDTEIGALDLNEVKGDELLSDLNQIRSLKKEIRIVRQRNHGDDYEPELVSEHHKKAIIGSDGEDEDLVDVEVERRENRIDCESILTYNSNLYNHPKLIIEPRKRTTSRATSSRMDVDSDDARSRSGRTRSIASTRATVLSKLSIRPKDESAEDRRLRKKALKQYRHERRQERKQNRQIFKSEQVNLVKQQRTNMPALKLS